MARCWKEMGIKAMTEREQQLKRHSGRQRFQKTVITQLSGSDTEEDLYWKPLGNEVFFTLLFFHNKGKNTITELKHI